MVDGIDSNDPWMAQSMMNAVMAAGDAGTMLPIDAIDEFRTEQNPGAQLASSRVPSSTSVSSREAICGTAPLMPTAATVLGTPGTIFQIPLSRRLPWHWSNTAAVLAAVSFATNYSSSEITNRKRTTASAIRCNTRCRSRNPEFEQIPDGLVTACNAAHVAGG